MFNTRHMVVLRLYSDDWQLTEMTEVIDPRYIESFTLSGSGSGELGIVVRMISGRIHHVRFSADEFLEIVGAKVRNK